MKKIFASAGASLLIAAFALLSAAPSAHSAAPLARKQVPGFFRVTVGAFEVTALFDGLIGLDTKLLKNASAGEIESLMAGHFLPGSKYPASCIAFLVNTGRELILVDAGTGTLWGRQLGGVAEAMKESGYTPDQVDFVLLTHLHGDHMGGLLTPDGARAFPNARVRVAKAESDYWLSENQAQQAPEDKRPYFKLARDTAAPYLASNRWDPFEPGQDAVPGVVRSMALPGHTPGHTGYEISSNGETLLFCGDVIHIAAVQFDRPDTAIEFDTDTAQAVETRAKIFDRAVEEKFLVAAAHLPFPGLGHLSKDGKKYVWAPVLYAPAPETAENPAK